MNLLDILYHPYVIIIILSIFITLIMYVILQKDPQSKKNEAKDFHSKILLYTFLISVIILFILKYLLHYLNKKNFVQKGAAVDITDKLTIVADDIDYGLLED